jgi:hypothetical protein
VNWGCHWRCRFPRKKVGWAKLTCPAESQSPLSVSLSTDGKDEAPSPSHSREATTLQSIRARTGPQHGEATTCVPTSYAAGFTNFRAISELHVTW